MQLKCNLKRSVANFTSFPPSHGQKVFKKLKRFQYSFKKLYPGLTSIEKVFLSYSFIHEVYGKKAGHTKFIQKLKSVLKLLINNFVCLF